MNRYWKRLNGDPSFPFRSPRWGLWQKLSDGMQNRTLNFWTSGPTNGSVMRLFHVISE